jgi:hypothetical protein
MSGVVTAAEALRAVAVMRKAQVLRIDDFEKACKDAGPPTQVRMPSHALDFLVAANINYAFTDTIDTAIARYLGSPFSPNIQAQNAVRCDALRQIYVRICSRRPRWSRPCAVTPIVRCTLMACIRSNVTSIEPDSVLPLLETELRLDTLGIFTIPSTIAGVRMCLRALLVSLCVILACQRFLKTRELLVRVVTQAMLVLDACAIFSVTATIFSEHVDAKCRQDPWMRHWYYAAVYALGLLVLL